MDNQKQLGHGVLVVPRMGIGAMVWGQPRGLNDGEKENKKRLTEEKKKEVQAKKVAQAEAKRKREEEKVKQQQQSTKKRKLNDGKKAVPQIQQRQNNQKNA